LYVRIINYVWES